ncbi:restriction endonuclease type II-like protein [Lipomyces arxii]|uniref:restriction endonuclease type II-like protein n=1 Tax=Lipomyces arxii TaxID=56418 RepID=UPI0034D01F04
MADEYSFDDADIQALDRIVDQAIQQPPQGRPVLSTTRPPSSASIAPSRPLQAQAGQSRNAVAVQKPLIQQPVPKKIGTSSGVGSIIVSPRQKGNPILQHIRNVPWEYGDIGPDYLIDPTIAIFFLSLKYHRLHPEYIYNRITKAGKNFHLRVLLVVVDIDNHAESIKDLTKTSVVNDLTVILAWSAQEAGHYLSLFGVLRSTPPTAIQASQKEDFSERIVDVLTSVRGVNKTDAANLMSTFGSLNNAVKDGGRTMTDIGGWGDLKVRRFRTAITEPFVVRRPGASKFASALAQKKATAQKSMAVVQPYANVREATTSRESSPVPEEQDIPVAVPPEEEVPESFTGIMAELNKLRNSSKS